MDVLSFVTLLVIAVLLDLSPVFTGVPALHLPSLVELLGLWRGSWIVLFCPDLGFVFLFV